MRLIRKDIVTAYWGGNYPGAPGNSTPSPFMWLAMDVHMTFLASRTPRALVTSAQRSNKSFATDLGLAINDAARTMNLAQASRDTVFNAMTSIGVVKIAQRSDGMVNLGADYDSPVTKTFLAVVDPEDVVWDMAATNRRRLQYVGDRYRVNLEEAMENKRFDKDARDKLYDAQRDYDDGQKRLEAEGRDSELVEFEKTTELLDLYFPRTDEIATFFEHDLSIELSRKKWKGHPAGPYRFLSFADVPNKTLPLPPAAQWLEGHIHANAIKVKENDQSERQKTIGLADKQSFQDAEKVRNASDGEIILTNGNPRDAIAELSIGGVDQRTQIGSITAKSDFDFFASGLTLLAGIGASSDTVGQDKMINANATRRIATMSASVTEFYQDVLETIGWYEFTEPAKTRKLVKSIKGSNIQIPIEFNPSKLPGEFEDYRFEIAPYSFEYKSPAERLAVLDQTMNQVLQALPLFQAQGVIPDLKEWLRLRAEYTGIDEIADILRSVDPEALEGAERRIKQSPNTTRTNVRENRSGGSPGAVDQAAITALSGAQNQPVMAGMN